MKKPKPTTTVYVYKCRMCSRTFTGVESGAGRESMNLVDAIYNIRVNNQLPIPMCCIHRCKKNYFGIGDLKGCLSK